MAAKPEGKGGEEAGAAPKAASSGGGGLKPWLPLLANLVLMPVMGYLTVNFFLLPKTKEPAAAEASAPEKKSESKEKPAKSEGGEGKAGVAKGERVLVPLSAKVISNIQGTQGTRYLLAAITLEGNGAGFKDIVDKSDAELRDAANSVLTGKSIADIDKPGAKNQIRAELLTVFNGVVGPGIIKQVFLTEFAMQ